MKFLLSGKPSLILDACNEPYKKGQYILWGLPSGLLLQTPRAKVFLESCRLPASINYPSVMVDGKLWPDMTPEELESAYQREWHLMWSKINIEEGEW
jgi:hypothetical protein